MSFGQGPKVPCRVWSHCASQLLEWISSALDDQLRRGNPGANGSQSSTAAAQQLSLWHLYADVAAIAQQSGRAVVLPDVVGSLVKECQRVAEAAQPSAEKADVDPEAMIDILHHLQLRRADSLLSSVEHR